MTKVTLNVLSAAAILAAAALVGPATGLVSRAAAADQLPPCSKTLNDHCVTMGGEAMPPSPEVKAKQQENVKAVEKKAGEVGDATAKAAKKAGKKMGEWGHQAKEKMKSMMGGSSSASSKATPHGCSPVTTPCE